MVQRLIFAGLLAERDPRLGTRFGVKEKQPFFTRSQIKEFFKDFTLEKFIDVEKLSDYEMDKPLYWHTLRVIAKKVRETSENYLFCEKLLYFNTVLV